MLAVVAACIVATCLLSASLAGMGGGAPRLLTLPLPCRCCCQVFGIVLGWILVNTNASIRILPPALADASNVLLCHQVDEVARKVIVSIPMAARSVRTSTITACDNIGHAYFRILLHDLLKRDSY